MIKSLVLGGGFMRAFCYIGVFKALGDKLNDIETFVCSSAGSVFPFIYMLGYSMEEMEELFLTIDFSSFSNITLESLLTISKDFGIEDGEKYTNLLKILIKKKTDKDDITFKELYELSNKRLVLTGSCVNTQSVDFFGEKETPYMSVIQAIRITCTIPFYYKVIEYNEKIYVDGGVLNNYPIDYFGDDLEGVLGYYIVEQCDNCDINSVEDFCYKLLLSVRKKFEDFLLKDHEDITILLICESECNTVEITKDERLKYIQIGYDKTKEYFLSIKSEKDIEDNSI